MKLLLLCTIQNSGKWHVRRKSICVPHLLIAGIHGVWPHGVKSNTSQCVCRALLGKEALGSALVPDNDRLAGCFLHSSRQAINLSVPASLEIPALRLRRGRGGRRLNSQKCGFLNTSVNSQCCAGFYVSLLWDFWCRVRRWSAIYSSSSTYVDGNQPTLPLTSPLHQPFALIFV